MSKIRQNPFAKGVHQSGGQSFLFKQSDFHESFTYSDAGVKQANSEKSIEDFGGYCWALCLVFIQSNGNFFNFTNCITSARGRGMVRGYQAMQHNSKLDFFHRWRTNVDLGKIILQGTVSSEGKSEILEFKGPLMTPLISFLENRKQHFTLLSLKQSKNSAKEHGKRSGHSICIINTIDQIAVFDPNHGLGLFQKASSQPEKNFCQFINEMIRIFYHKNGYDFFRAVAYSANDNFIRII